MGQVMKNSNDVSSDREAGEDAVRRQGTECYVT